MADTLDPHLSTLLGRYLLGDAPPEVIEELRLARSNNPLLGEVMDLLESAEPIYEASPFGDQGEQAMSELELPDYLKAEQLAGYYMTESKGKKWHKPLCLFLAASGALRMVFAKDALSMTHGFFWVAIFPWLLLWFFPAQMRKQALRVAEGGDEWRKTVQGLSRLERISSGPWGRALFPVGVAVAALGAVLMTAAVFQPGENATLLRALGAVFVGGGSGVAIVMRLNHRRAVPFAGDE